MNKNDRFTIDEAKKNYKNNKVRFLIRKIKIIYVRFFEEKVAKSSSFEKSLVPVQKLKFD